MLNGTDLNKLQAAGIVTNNIERLVRYTGGSVKDYVGSYGNYYDGLSGRTGMGLDNKLNNVLYHSFVTQ